MNKSRLWHFVTSAILGGGAIATELLTTSKYAHASWGPGALMAVSWIVMEVKAAQARQQAAKLAAAVEEAKKG